MSSILINLILLLLFISCNSNTSMKDAEDVCLNNLQIGGASEIAERIFSFKFLKFHLNDSGSMNELWVHKDSLGDEIKVWVHEGKVLDFSCGLEHQRSKYIHRQVDQIKQKDLISKFNEQMKKYNSCVNSKDCSKIRIQYPFSCWYPISQSKKLKAVEDLFMILDKINFDDSTCAPFTDVKCIKGKCVIDDYKVEFKKNH